MELVRQSLTRKRIIWLHPSQTNDFEWFQSNDIHYEKLKMPEKRFREMNIPKMCT